jgi:hypothetical protein
VLDASFRPGWFLWAEKLRSSTVPNSFRCNGCPPYPLYP